MKTYVTFGQVHTHSINRRFFDKQKAIEQERRKRSFEAAIKARKIGSMQQCWLPLLEKRKLFV